MFMALVIVIIGSVVIFFVGLLLSLIIPVAIVFTVLWVIWLITREGDDLEPKTDDDRTSAPDFCSAYKDSKS